MADIIISGDKEKSMYLTQIKYLEEQLERCQLESDEFEKKNKDLASQYCVLQKDKADTTEYLKRSVAAKEGTVDELTEQIKSQQQAAEQDRDSLKLQHSRQMKELQDQIDEQNSGIRMQAAKFAELQKKKKLLTKMVSNIEPLKKKLVSQREEHEAAIYRVMKEAESDMTNVIEKEQIRVDACIERKASEVLHKERAVHIERLQQLPFLLDEILTLTKEKDVLQDKQRDLMSERDILNDESDKITQESLTCKKEMKQQEKIFQQLRGELKNLTTAYERIRAEEDAIKWSLASVTKQSSQKTAEAGQLRAELQRESRRIRRLEDVMQEADIILRHILMDSEKSSETEQKLMRLLEILESTVIQGT
ncbi:basal body-orientation factor 1-like [Epinephelus fuscoguttatus]|uniref:basal body-orientation factor 1-like n=1 Tax=Epinephelus fuscoguttatus TaxID=293821 RepID=UPI0020D19EA1|nr:basal body-orientation factor 1-like [Epinephelus fuscoguttatus]XP_049430456.1 basal body-orientation factor 1-like [Epinephelus fuscoguttatus]